MNKLNTGEQIVPNGVYFFNFSEGDCGYIARMKGNSKTILTQIYDNRLFSTFGSFVEQSVYREATEDEIKWLEACEKVNKYVNSPTINSEVLIFN